MAYQEKRVEIPHPNPTVQQLIGIICSPNGNLNGGSALNPQTIALICHGVQAHKNQTYHRSLASALSKAGIASIRIDFQANGESPGEWSWGDFWKEEEDFDALFSWLEQRGWRPDIVIAHSRGSITANRYLCTMKKRHPGRHVPNYFVNLSGRYVMARILVRLDTWKEQFDTVGYVEVKNGKRRDRGTREQLIDFATFDTSRTIVEFPRHTHVLTLHGTKDTLVPFNDGEIYQLIYSVRGGKGTSEFKAIDGADHNFIGKFDIVVDAIMEWLLRMRQQLAAPKAKL
ncbi:alpha/beta-hydrolase [Atractiella rhizophila]|nr:alpha/beta-hydrolase [Atractiella rhizophila]